MAEYTFRGRDRAGRRVQGRVEAESAARAVERLRERGTYITHLQVRRSVKEVLAPRPGKAPPGGRVPVKDLALFCRQFGTMAGAGVPVLNALALLGEQVSSKLLRQILKEVAGDVEAGLSLAAALARHSRHLPPALVNMAAAGEMAGILEEVFNRLADHFEKEHAVTQKVRSAMAYPVVVLVMAVAVVLLLLTFVVPNFVLLFEGLGTALPWPTRLLLDLSGFVRRHLLLILGAGGLLAAALLRAVRTPRGAALADRWILRVPAIGPLVLKQAVARFCRTLSSLLASGVPILSALEVVQGTVGNRMMADLVGRTRVAVLEGNPMVHILRSSPLIPSMVTQMIAVGEETGQTEAMLLKVAEFYERDIDALVERFAATIQPLVMAGLGIGIGFVLVAMIMPMFEIFGMIGGQ
jgi:type IV pilus assembly protein PilC